MKEARVCFLCLPVRLANEVYICPLLKRWGAPGSSGGFVKRKSPDQEATLTRSYQLPSDANKMSSRDRRWVVIPFPCPQARSVLTVELRLRRV